MGLTRRVEWNRDAAVAVQDVLTATPVVGAVAVEDPGVVHVGRRVGHDGNRHGQPGFDGPRIARGMSIPDVIGVVPAEQMAIALGVGLANPLELREAGQVVDVWEHGPL